MSASASQTIVMERNDGTLIVTSDRVLFRPSLWDRLFAFWLLRTIAIPRDAVVHVDVEQTGSGQTRQTFLRLMLNDGSQEEFRLEGDAAKLAEPIRDELASVHADAPLAGHWAKR